MAFRAIYDIVVHAETFRNIDLFYQGLYFVKFKIFYESNGQVPFFFIQKIFAHPYSNSSALWPSALPDNKGSEGNQLFKDNQIDEDESSFSTKTFLIKFCEEEVEINDFCHFRVEVDVQPNYENVEFKLEASLFFFDCNNSAQNAGNANKGNSVSTSNIVVRNVQNPFSEFIPLIFYEQNFSVLNSTFHVICLDFHHRLHTMHLSQFIKKLKEPKYNNDSTQILEEILNRGPPIDFMTYLKEKFKGRSINATFFRGEFTKRLEENFEWLLFNYDLLVSKCIDEKQKKQFSKHLSSPQKLIIPEYMKATEESFKESEDPDLIYAYVFSEINFISEQIIMLWLKYIDVIKISPLFVSAFLRFQYEAAVKERWETGFSQQIFEGDSFRNEWRSNFWDQRKASVSAKRNALRTFPFKLHVSFLDKV